MEPGRPPYLDQGALYLELMREGFEISQDDEAGLAIDIESDFLLSDVNVAVRNRATG